MRTVTGMLGAFALALTCLWTVAVQADFAQVPLEELVKKAATIVEGKVVKVEDAGFMRNGRKYDAAVVEVKSVLKGDAKLKEVRIAQPALGGLSVSTDIRFKVGQEGIWLLNQEKDAKDKEAAVLWATHPSQFQPSKEKETVAKAIKAQAKPDK